MQFHESSTHRKFIQKAIKIKFYRVFIDENSSYSKQSNNAEYRNRLTINLRPFLFTRLSRVLRNIFSLLLSFKIIHDDDDVIAHRDIFDVAMLL
jgi:hypothetical protein